MILVIDNYDSFVWNLVQRLGEIDAALDIRVVRNDAITPSQTAELRPSHIIISPGPCTPAQAGASNAIVRRFAGTVPILGVCLGHQCIGAVFGGDIVRNHRIMHGKTSMICHDARGIFSNIENPFAAMRYHSLVVDRDTWRHPDFEVSAWTDEHEIMGLRHCLWRLDGVQFHPESFLTGCGSQLLRNFLDGAASTCN